MKIGGCGSCTGRVDRFGLGELVGFTESGVVGRDHLEPAGGQHRVKGEPGSGSAGRVQEQHVPPTGVV
jgi:hypothetical protein